MPHSRDLPLLQRVCLALLLASTVTGCVTKAPSGRDAWKQVLSKCTATEDLPTSRQLYFGPSNPIGPGSVWVPKDNGGYGLRFTLNQPVPSEGERAKFIVKGTAATCDGTSNVKWSLKPSVTFSSPGTPVEADLGLALDKAQNVKVSVKSWRVDRLQEYEYESWAKSPTSGGYGEDLLGSKWQSRSFMDAAIAVSGFTAELTFDAKMGAELKAKYPNPTLNLGAAFSGSWDGNRTLKITSSGEFYVAGSLSKVKAPGTLGMFSGAGEKRRVEKKAVRIPSDAKAGMDEYQP